MVVALPLIFTVHDVMVVSGVNDTNNFDGYSTAECTAEGMFEDDFSTCMDKTHEDIDNDFKTFLIMTVAQGQIRLLPGVKKRIKSFIQ